METPAIKAVDSLRARFPLGRDRDAEARRQAFERVLRELNVARGDLSAWSDGLDIVGTVYEQLLSSDERRVAGQFFTPFWAGEVMAGWAFDEKVDLVLDPGCGSGGLLIPAARHPKRKRAELLGVDVDPLAVLMLETNVRLRAMTGVTARQANFLLDELGEAPGAILCNPPYSRHHVIPADEKGAIHDGFERRLGIRFNGLSALHVLFLVRALEVAADGARIAFITPSDWLDVGYGRRVKEFLLERAQVEAIVLIEESHLFFDGVLTTAGITLIRNGKPSNEPTKILRLTSDLPDPEAVLGALADGGGAHEVERVKLTASEKWSRGVSKMRRGHRLGELARVRRGIATGANSFFAISERTRKAWRIQPRSLKRCISSPRLVNGIEVTTELLDALDDDVPRWLIDSEDPRLIDRDTALGRYVRYGRDELKIPGGYLAGRRKPWYRLERRVVSPILFTYFNRERPRFVRNRAGAVPLNNWLIIEPNEGVDADVLHRALQSASVREQLGEKRRVYGGGLWKLEPSELLDIRVSGRAHTE